MNIIFLLNSTYPYYKGGRETWINNITNRMCESANVTIITEKPYLDKNITGVFHNINPKVKIIPITNINNTFLRIFTRSYLSYISQKINSWIMRYKLDKIVRKSNEKNVIIAMDSVFMANVGYRLKKKYDLKMKFIVSVRSTHAEIIGERYTLLKKIILKNENIYLSSADEIWANGWDTNNLLKQKGFSSTIIKNGVHYERCNSENLLDNDIVKLVKKDAYNIITIGTLMDIKGYNEIIKAIALIKEKYGLSINLVALGKGSAKKYLNLADKLGIKDCINFVGEVSQTIEYAKQFDLAACLSGGSGLSMACLESMCSRTPVIAWDTAVYRQMMTHKKSGYLVECQNIKELCKGIYWMSQNKEQGEKMGLLANEITKGFGWDDIVIDIDNRLNRL